MASSYNDDTCVICNQGGGGDGRILRQKGLTSLIEVSRKRKNDSISNELISPGKHFVHNNCYKSYTCVNTVSREQIVSVEGPGCAPLPLLRSENPPFDYKTHCLICSELIDFEAINRHPDRHSHVSNVEMVSKEKAGIIQQSLIEACMKRQDPLAVRVKARVAFAGDIRAVEAKYHQTCMQNFFISTQNNDTPNTHNVNTLKNEAFAQLCNWLTKEQREHQHTLVDLQKQLSTYLPEDVMPYSTTHIKRRLIELFGNEMTISEAKGRTSSVVTFNENAFSILQHKYHESVKHTKDVDERMRLARQVGQNIQDVIKSSTSVTPDVYPSPADIDLERLEAEVPEELLQLTESLFPESRSESARSKKKLLQMSMCHVIMQSTAKQTFISPLLLSVGLFIHQQTRSRVLLDVLSSLGLSVSYDQVIAFERSAVVGRSIGDLPPGLIEQKEDKGFCQWVADNFDFNEDNLTGHDSTHVMGIITCQSPRHAGYQVDAIPRRHVSASEIISAGDFGDMIQPYKPPARSRIQEMMIKAINPISIPTKQYEYLDTLWLSASLLSKCPPNWQGFMSNIEIGHCECTTIVYNPMIPLNPQTNEAVYSTMKFVLGQARKLGMCCATLTFDQPLYLKAYKMKQDNLPDFQKINLRLGGFHQLMSFLGVIGKLMDGSGLEDLWATVYARNSLPKMIEGKAYTKALRACLLTAAALHVVLMGQNEFPTVDELVDNGQENNMETDPPDMLPLQELYNALMSHAAAPENVTSSDDLSALYQSIQAKMAWQTSTRTGKLWVMFMKMVETVRMYIRAERTGNWLLHLKATQDMLPGFAAAGHNNYTRCCRLYLQDSQELCPCLVRPMEEGLFTIRRKEKPFWSGTWSDMAIEQCLMRAGKTQGGLINITHKEAARTKWLLSAHVIAQYSDALRNITNTYTGTWSDQHREMNPSSQKRDFCDLEKFVTFLESHNPFAAGEVADLRNIATGVIADSRVNVDDAWTIGCKIQNNLTGQFFGAIVLKKTDQARTFAVMRKPVNIGKQDVHMSSAELYQRLLTIAYVNGPPDRSIFKHELATVAPALFEDDGSMRKSNKSQLANHILKMDPGITSQNIENPVSTVFDGCALLHRLSWPKVGTLDAVCKHFVLYVVQHKATGIHLCVVFDSYDVPTTKDTEQKRRQKQTAPDQVIEPRTSVPTNKTAFLSNKRNKKNLIELLDGYLTEAGVQVKHAGEEGDADVIIVQTTLDIAGTHTVRVAADDTDILILLLYHSNEEMNIYMETKTQTISIRAAQDIIGKVICKCLLFAHAISGCDTTSALYGIGKIKPLKLLQSSSKWQADVLIVGDTGAPPEEVLSICENFIGALYKGGVKAPKSLDELRYLNIISSHYVPIERMPPTNRSCRFHSLRVHHQVSTWRNLRTVLKKEDFGFKLEDGSVVAVITDMSPAPPDVLRDIRCACKSNKNLCASCSCAKTGLPCSIHCKCEGHCDNSTPFDTINDENDTM